MKQRLFLYAQLVRLDKPEGSLLLLWPTLNALWIASHGHPSLGVLAIFVLGTVLMRSAGCAINDYADRNFDLHVKRTHARPLAAKKIRPAEAVALAAVLALLAFLLIWPFNTLTKKLSLAAVFVAASYPFTKRFFVLPQAYLGLAFGFGIPMAFAAVQAHVPPLAWAMVLANVFWSLAYDTEYAMVDRDDDIKIGIRTSALTFGRYDVFAVMVCYLAFFTIYAVLGWVLHYTWPFWLGFAAAVACAVYHYTLIRKRLPSQCFTAFKHNNWLGGLLFAGIAGHYAFIEGMYW